VADRRSALRPSPSSECIAAGCSTPVALRSVACLSPTSLTSRRLRRSSQQPASSPFRSSRYSCAAGRRTARIGCAHSRRRHALQYRASDRRHRAPVSASSRVRRRSARHSPHGSGIRVVRGTRFGQCSHARRSLGQNARETVLEWLRALGFEILRPPRALLQNPKARLGVDLEHVIALRLLDGTDLFFVQIGALTAEAATNSTTVPCGTTRAGLWRSLIHATSPS
jgi:hypothetical protein